MGIPRLAQLICTGLALAACSAGAHGEEPIELRFATWGSLNSYYMKDAVTPFIEAVNRDLGGVAVLKHYPSGVLGDNETMYDVIRNGTADIGLIVTSTQRHVFTRSTVIGVPLVYETALEGSVALWKLFESGVTASDFESFKVISLYAYPPSNLQSTRPIERVEDIRGARIRISSRMQAITVRHLGGVPVWVGLGDIYQSLEKGLVDAACVSWTGVGLMNLQEVTDYHVPLGISGSSAAILMNLDSWNRLPPAVQNTLDRHGGLNFAMMHSNAADNYVDKVVRATRALPGHSIVDMSPEDFSRWERAVSPVVDEWIERVPDGSSLLQQLRQEVEKVRRRTEAVVNQKRDRRPRHDE